MNVLVTIASLNSAGGGPPRTTTALCSSLASAGATVGIVTVDCSNQSGGRVMPTSPAVNVKLVPGHYSTRTRLVWSRGFKRALHYQAQQSNAQLVHDNGVWQTNNHFSAQVARNLQLPLIVTPRGMLEPWSLQHRGWKKRLAWHLYQRRDLASARVVHATSEMEAAGIRSLGLQQPIAVIPNGVDLPQISEAPRADTGCRTALFLSRLHPKKGLLNLVRAWAEVRPKGWHAIIAGPDENGHRGQVEAAVRNRGLTPDFTFAGPVEGKAKWDLFQRADLFVLPTHSENFGVVIAEALAAGVPVITTKGAPWAELQSHRCGWWIDVGTAPFAAALREATSISDGQRVEMGARGRDLVARRYSWLGVAENMLRLYEWVLNDAPRPEFVLTA